MNTLHVETNNVKYTVQTETDQLKKSLEEAAETIEYMINSLMWSAEYKVLAQSKEKLWKLKKVLATLEN